MSTKNFQALLQSFFTERMLQQRQASPHTIAGYRDCFRLLLNFAAERLRKQPSKFTLEALDSELIADFLTHLEQHRGNSARTRNTRLAALHSFFRYVALNEPIYALHCQRILAIPSKRYEKKPIAFLERAESEAVLAVQDTGTWTGRRDHTLLLVAIQTGLRVSELISLRCKDVVLGAGAHVRCWGKGRKQRSTPLRKEAASQLKRWLCEREGVPEAPVFPSIRGGALSRDAVERLVTKHAQAAALHCPSLKGKTVTAHVLRHTTAMELLHNGVDRSVIAMWLGHESVETTQIYLHADMKLKEKALSHTTPLATPPSRFQPGDPLLRFLESL